jgi:hypothetical protein
MKNLMLEQLAGLLGVIQAAEAPALRVGFTLALIVIVLAGILIWRRRHQLFDRDPEVDNDVPIVQHNREEEIILVW